MTTNDAARPLRIFHINMHLKWGGQPNRVLTTARGLRARGHHVCLAGPRGAMLTERARKDGFETFEELELKRGFAPLSMRRDVRALEAHFHASNYDVLDLHGSQDTWVSVLAWRRLDQPRPCLVRTRHNTFPVARNPFNRWLYGKMDHIVTISPQVIPLLKGLVPDDDFTPIYSAPDPARFDIADRREDVRAELGYKDDDEVIGVVGRLAPEKGHTVLLDAAPEIIRARPHAKFLFVGTGRSRRDLETKIAAMGLTDRVTFTGFREDVPRLLKAMDLFVLSPTSGESLGTAILEAFLMERPVVATDVGGVGESVRDGETGRLVPPHDPRSLGDAIVDQLSNPGRARTWALAGKALIEREFTPEMIGEKTEAVYRRILARRDARRRTS